MTAVLVCILGALGAAGRFVVDGAVRSRLASATPWSTIAVNVSGSFVLGVVTGLASWHGLPQTATAAVGTGLCGGYTTFSTSAYETVRLLERGESRAALLSGAGTLLLCLAAAGAGMALASL